MRLEALLLQSKRNFTELRKTPLKLFVRAKGLEPIGIMTKRVHKFDSGWGQMRTWAIGLTFDEPGLAGAIAVKSKRFEEPLDRKNRRTGELEDLVQMENDFLIVTARNTSDPDDDNDDNFQYFIPPHSANRMKDSTDRVKERDRIIQDLEKKVGETEQSRDFYQREAEAYGNEIRMLKGKVANISERVANAEQQADHYRTLVKKTQTTALEEEGFMDEKMTGARPRGSFTAKDSADVVTEAAKRQKEAQKHLTSIGAGQMSPEFATKADLTNMERKIMEAIKVVAGKEEKRPSEAPPPPKKSKPELID